MIFGYLGCPAVCAAGTIYLAFYQAVRRGSGVVCPMEQRGGFRPVAVPDQAGDHEKVQTS